MSSLFGCSMSDYTTDLGEGYIFVSESSTTQFIYNEETTYGTASVPCSIEDFTYDDNFIIATQKDNRECSLNKDLSKVKSTFWIIEKKKHTVYGPLDSTFYYRKRDSMSIPETLYPGRMSK
jgi:hypothetical protein